MFYKVTPEIFYEKDCVVKHSGNIAKLGIKAVIVTGKSSAKNGALQDVLSACNKEGIAYLIYDSIKENPEVEQVMEISEIARKAEADFVIGIGGGSAIDAAKAVAVMTLYKEQDASFLFCKQTENKSLPLVAVPTTCGTGTEATPAAVLTDHNQHNKASMSHRIFPTLSLVDDKYLETLPHSVLCDTSIDALGHLIEGVVNSTATQFSNLFAKEGLRTWAKCKNVLLDSRARDEESYHNLMWASLMGGFTIAHTGTTLPHGLSYIPTYYSGLPHGKAVGYFLYGFLKYASLQHQNQILELTEFDSLEQLRDFITEVCHLEKISDEILEKCIDSMKVNQKKLAYCPYPVDEQILRKVAYSYEGNEQM